MSSDSALVFCAHITHSTFEGSVDQKSIVKIYLCQKNLLLDTVIARTSVSLGFMSGDRSVRTIDLFDPPTRKIVVASMLVLALRFDCLFSLACLFFCSSSSFACAELVLQATYKGRGGPRAPRGSFLTAGAPSSTAGGSAGGPAVQAAIPITIAPAQAASVMGAMHTTAAGTHSPPQPAALKSNTPQS